MPHYWTLFPAFAILLASPAGNRHAAPTRGPAPGPECAAPEYRQFDFWLGDWDTFEAGKAGKSVARNRVTRMLDGCAIREVNDGLVGESFNAYDADQRLWHQSWVTNRGQWLVLEGHLAAGRSRGRRALRGHRPDVATGVRHHLPAPLRRAAGAT
jgi:hypothetical protein